jgi:hypothetical protein
MLDVITTRLAQLFLLLALGLLAGCATEPVLRLTPPAGEAGAACAAACQSAMDGCAERCRSDALWCNYKDARQADRDYRDYLDSMRNTDMEISRTPEDFRHRDWCPRPIECRAGCRQTFTACYERCGGKVEVEPAP